MLYASRMDEDVEVIAERIYRLRAQRGWSQSELARRADISRTTMSSLEGARRFPTLPTLRKLAGAFGLPVMELLADNPDATPLHEPQDVGANSKELAE